MLRRLISRVKRTLRGTRGKQGLDGVQPAREEQAPAVQHAHRGTHPGHRPAAGPQGHHRQEKADGAAPRQHRHPVEHWSQDRFVVEPAEGKSRFHDFSLPATIMHGIADLGFSYCTPVQAAAMPVILAGKDMAARAQTGTGKTAAFLISTFARLLSAPRRDGGRPGSPRALVLEPTRELVVQILKDAGAIGRHCGLRNMAVFGGMDYAKQRKDLMDGPVDLVAATPGRLLDFQRQGQLRLGEVEILVIDEADRMLDMGFIPDVRRIVSSMPAREKRQTMLFSATLSAEVLRLASQWMVNPAMVEIEPEKVTVDRLSQIIYAVPSKQKFTLLVNLLRKEDMNRVLVFANRRDVAAQVAEDLNCCGIRCRLISGSMPQERRMRVLEEFRSGSVPVLVATDVAARGIHVDDVSHVINYDIPYEPEDYVHRIGRTARIGKDGTAITLACEREAFTIPDIEKFIGKPITCTQPDEALLKPTERVLALAGKPRPHGREHRGPRSGASSGRGMGGHRPRGHRSSRGRERRGEGR